jgi:Protein of unknown function (DUF2934)
MSRKQTKKNNAKTGYNDSLKSKRQMSESSSEHIAVTEQSKQGRSAQSGRVEALRPSEKSRHPGRNIEIPRERIEERAKAIWEQRGRPQGDDQGNWYEAENQLRRELVGQE